MATRQRRGLLSLVVVLAAMSFLPACALVAGIGVSGRVVDGETGQPIEGAVVSLQRTAHCASFHAYSRPLPPAEARTDGTGRFSVGSGRTATTAGCLSWAWSRSLRILNPGYLEEFLFHDDSWLRTERRQFNPLKTDPVTLERMRYALELRPYRATTGLSAPDDPRPGPAWQEAVGRIQAAGVRPTDSPGVFVRRTGAVFDQIAVVELLGDRYLRRRAVVVARDRRTGGVHGWTETGASISLPLPVPGGWSLVGASRRLGVPLLERDAHLYYPDPLDWTEPLRGVTAHTWSRVATQRGDLRAVASYKQGWVAVEAGGSAITTYSVLEQIEGKTRLRSTPSAGSPLALGDVLPGARPPVECLATRPEDDSLVMIAQTAEGRGLFLLPWWRLSRMEWLADRTTISPRLFDSDVIACAASPSSLYVALRDRGIVRLAFARLAVEPLPQALLGATLRNVLGLATGSVGGGEAVYAVTGDDAVYRFAASGEPDRRLELDLPRTSGR